MSVDQQNEDELLASSTMSSTEERSLLRSPDPDHNNDFNILHEMTPSYLMVNLNRYKTSN